MIVKILGELLLVHEHDVGGILFLSEHVWPPLSPGSDHHVQHTDVGASIDHKTPQEEVG